MTEHLSKKQTIKFTPGTIIVGKWHQKQYQIIKPLGYGARGTVFLAHSEYGRVALKFGFDNAGVTSEVNVLNKFSKVQGEPLGPSLYDVDDWVTKKGAYAFYAMEYINGTPLLDCIRVRGFEWAAIFVLQLLKDLGRLHEAGWVFGDLKPDNLVVTGPPLKIRWLDVGGTTQMGRSIKEYTEFFDRGYWGFGTRKAEPSYDLFAVAMIFVNAAEGRRMEKGQDPEKNLIRYIQSHRKLAPYADVITQALYGKFSTAEQMRKALLKKINETQSEAKRITKNQVTKRKSKKKAEWKGTFLLVSIILLAYTLYVALFIM
ncbi:putative serine/threonine-protein kinase YabT [Pullulanibacillus camelliae]|uniref:Putative serine/threonine-protein kinase YabT n=1 Tax=Pullulanibacillus camelliae TaxID=1707096 RepID=A0A8J2YMQ8_9BACL|nr:protein kinase family protein [Pullulanibacillus camelliae]GGE54124.1 putative serine/threonine-protein kinase YabT [Pullulanibacillus camelliae]